MTFFIDTNFFLQCKKYDELKWSDITNDKDITILISRPVQIEIDKLKHDGNSRRSKRAKETTNLFRKILNEDNMTLIIETSNNNITLQFAKQYSDESLFKANLSLDITNNDEKILAILHNYIQDKLIMVESCAFLSNDTNPILTARLNNLPVIQIPDTWLLSPENDDRDKEILRLKQQVMEYQKKEPIIDIEFETNDYITATELSNEFNVKIQIYNQILQSDIEEFVDFLTRKHPKKTNFNTDEDKFDKKLMMLTSFMSTYYPPNEEEIKEYDLAYKNWQNEISELFSSYADKHNENANIFPFNINIKNDGNIPAENLLLDFEVLSGGKLVFPDFNSKEIKKRWAYPNPPKHPEGRMINHSFSAIEKFTNAFPKIYKQNTEILPTILSKFLTPPVHNKNTFYWKDGKPNENTPFWRFECDEFRHKLVNEKFSYHLVFYDNSEKIVFQVRVSASNMSLLMEKIYILHKKSIYIEPKNDILYLIKHGVTEDVMRKIEGKDKE